MATGTPKRRNGAKANGADMSLVYAGKTPASEVLRQMPAKVMPMWQGHNARNRLYFAENSAVLAGLVSDPAVRGKVKLIYIDPPFATQTTFHSRKLAHAYEDTLAGTDYIEYLRQRVILLRELLADDGCLYMHIDEKMVFHLKLILDEVFGAQQYRNCITRKKCNPKNYTRKQYGNVADYILFYTKSDKWVWNKPTEPWTTQPGAKEYQYVEEKTGRRYMKVPVHAPGVRRGETGKAWRGKLPPPGKHWQYKPSTLDEMDARGEIYWSSNGNPRRKVYLDESKGVGVQDIWLDFRDAHNQNICITGYPTEKNPDLLARIIEASSRPGDLVLDCFAGSGTTMAVASKLGRQWIGIDNSPEALRTTMRRFTIGTEPMGDFVGLRGRKGRQGNGTADLFGGLPGHAKPASKDAILDFELIVDAALRSEAELLLKEIGWPMETPVAGRGGQKRTVAKKNRTGRPLAMGSVSAVR